MGCIFAELLIHEPFFRGDNPQHQLEVITSKLGCPPRAKLDFISHEEPLNAVLKYEHRKPPPFNSFFAPNADQNGLDLMQRMLGKNEYSKN